MKTFNLTHGKTIGEFMGRIAGTCAICGRTSYDVFRCSLCGATVCERDFSRDINVCNRCLRKGLWVSDKGPE